MNRDNMNNNNNQSMHGYQSPVGVDVEIVNSLTNGLLGIHEEIGYLKQHILDNQSTGNPFASKNSKVGTVSLSSEDRKRLKEMSDSIVMLYSEVKGLKKQNSEILSEAVEQVGRQTRQQFVDMTKEVFTMEKVVDNMKNQIVDQIFDSISTKFNDDFFGNDSMVTKAVTNIVESIENKIEMKFSDVFITLNNVQKQMKDNADEIKMSYDTNLSALQTGVRNCIIEMNDNFNATTNEVQCNFNEQFAEIKSYVNNSYAEIKNEIETKTELNTEFMSKMQIEMRALNNKVDVLLERNYSQNNMDMSSVVGKLTGIDKEIDQLRLVDGDDENVSENQVAKSMPYTNSDFERKLETMSDDILLKFDDKFELLHGEIIMLQNNVENEIPKLIKETIATTLMSNNDEHIQGLLEKISNQLGADNLEKSNKIEAINLELDSLKNILNDESPEISEYDDDMSQTFSSLRGELDNLSKLIVEADEDEIEMIDSIPTSISNISEELDNLSKNMFEEE